jgi:phasin family protein
MFVIPEQFSTATKANFESQIAILAALTNKAFESAEKLVDLNLNVAKASIEESTAAAKQMISNPQEFFSLTTQVQPAAEKAIAYGRHLAGIMTSAQAEFTKAAEEQMAETNRKIVSLIDEVSKNAPVGSENVVSFVKSAIGNASAGYEQLTKSTKQAVDVMEANLNTAVTQFSQAASKAAAKTASKK